MKFSEKWDELKNLEGIVILEHCLFDKQMHNCDSLQIINDDRIGLILKGQEIYMLKQHVTNFYIDADMCLYSVTDGKLTINVLVNKM